MEVVSNIRMEVVSNMRVVSNMSKETVSSMAADDKVRFANGWALLQGAQRTVTVQ
jgi:hypothetical protein